MGAALFSLAEMRTRAAVEAVYRAFSGAVPARIEGCPCCIEARGTDILLTTPLRELSGEQLWPYVSGVFLTVGGEEDFRYLLPRILEISVSDPRNANDPEIVLGKLALADWRSWAEGEQQALEDYIDAWFERALERDVEDADGGWIGAEAESVLCGAARAGLRLERWLLRLHEPLAAPVLADLKARYPGGLSAFWEQAPEGFALLSTILAQGRA
jgi:hypothetical protein